MDNIKELDKKYIANTYGRFPITLVSGKGAKAYDEDGKEYIDMGSGIGVDIFGYCDDEWVNAVTAQLGKIQHTSNLYYTEPATKLAQLLCEKTGMKKAFFCNSGAEANECAIKVARKYAAEHKGPEYYTIITLVNSFHGRTLTTLAATGQDKFHQLFQPLTQGFVHAHANNLDEVKKLVENYKVAGIMFECVQGEGGVNNLDDDFVKGIAEICAREDIIMISDEVQTGNGRTGYLYAYMNYGINPDVVTTAKGLGGGLPISSCILGSKVENIFSPGDNGTTYGANPVCCAGAVNVLSRIDDKLLEEVRAKSKFVFDEFNGSKGIASVSGMGLMIGVEPVKPASEVVNECIKRGVLCLTAKNKIRLLPPLTITMDELSKAVETIKAVCAE